MSNKMIGLRIMPALGLMLLICLATALAGLLLSNRGNQQGDNVTAELAFLSQRLPLEARAAAQGDPAAFRALKLSRDRLQTARQTAANPAQWDAMLEATKVVLTAEPTVMAAHGAAEKVRELMPKLLGETGNMAAALGTTRWAGLARHLERFEFTGQLLAQDMGNLAAGVGDPKTAAQRVADGTDYLNQVIRGLKGEDTSLGITPVTGEEALQRLANTTQIYEQITEPLQATVASADILVKVDAAVAQLEARGVQLGNEIAAAGLGAGGIPRPASDLVLWAMVAALALMMLIAAIYYWSGDIRRAAQTHAAQNERNQEAILRLLDELGSLADGDLTVQATVTEDITGAIADSINYAIEALRDLVTTIKDSAIMVDAASKQTEATASHLARASQAQLKQVASATESVAHMARSVEEVSGNAERSADVARHSVDVAHKGGDAVRRTIDGMNTIRETIQDTSKRIKRLGESSQEIGNIVELINDIAEQTNILALNASIQASMAGEAGRGFAVVADEVQRLAERSANATKQIEVLVRTIQADTNEAVVSMERSTTDVVGGALLAENAGAALDEIEQVSNQIATLVQNISGSARQQATAAANISRNMGVLREISSQTVESTTATSNSISKLSELATQLRTSVAGFTLPDFATGTAVLPEPEMLEEHEIEATMIAEDDERISHG